MKFKQLSIQNFLSIKSAVVNLENQGLTLINGKNLDNEALNNNGSGKSSIVEGIVYAIYGKTLRGVKGDAVVNRTSNCNTKVFLDLIDDDGTEYRIARYRKHNTNKNKSFLYCNGTDITPKSESDFNDAVSKILQMDYLTFTSSILYSAESFKFTSATDAEMKSTFDTMLGLDTLTRCLEIVKSKLKQVDSDISNKNYFLSDYKNKLKEIESQKSELLEYCENWTTEQKQKLDFLSQEKEKNEQEIFDLNKDISLENQNQEKLVKNLHKLEEKLESIKKSCEPVESLKDASQQVHWEIEGLKKDIERSEKDIEKYEKSQKNVIRKIEKFEKDIEKYEIEKSKLDDTIGSPCPVCGNPLSIENIEPAKKEYDDKITQVNRDILFLREEQDALCEEIAKCKNSINSKQSEIDGLIKDKSEYDSLYKKAKKLLDSKDSVNSELFSVKCEISESASRLKSMSNLFKVSQNQLKKLEGEISEVKQHLDNPQSNPYLVMISKLDENMTSLQDKCGKLEEELNDIVDYKTGLEFWQKAYSNQGIKSYILDSITPYLNRRVNKYLSKLANNHIEVKFSTQTTLKSGEKREKFSLEIFNKDGGNDYISNSGGERRRIDLAVNLALIDLVASRSNKKLNIAIFDEVLDTLDNTGVENVLELLQELSKEKSSIFIISHNDHLKSYFDNVITIVKKNGCSTLE